MYYYLGPWRWVEDEGGCWAAPEGTVGLVDLRPYGGTTEPQGFFATDRKLGSDYDLVGTELDGILSAAQKGAWKTLLHLDSLSANNVLDALWEVLTFRADPEGNLRAKPLIPTVRGDLELWLGGHSLVRSWRFQGQSDPAWPNIQKVIQNDYRRIREFALSEAAALRAIPTNPKELAGKANRLRWSRIYRSARRKGITFDKAREAVADYQEKLHRRVLGGLERKYRTIAGREFIPDDLPDEESTRPETTITESFNKEDSGTLGPDLTWTEYCPSDSTWRVLDNQANYHEGPSHDACYGTARAENDLSSNDHYSELSAIVVQSGNSYQPGAIGPAVRFDSSIETCYIGRLWQHDNDSERFKQIYKLISGAYTQLASSDYTFNLPHTLRTQIDGTTLKLFIDTAEEISLTDTAISGGVRTGIHGREHGWSTGPRGDDFEAADLEIGLSIPVAMQHYRNLRMA